MRIRGRIAATACSVVFNAGIPVCGFPQADTLPAGDANAHSEQSSAAHELAPLSVARVYVKDDSRADSPVHVLPPNLEVSETYRQMLERMIDRSPTFRRQCRRLMSAPHMRVRIRTAFNGERPFVRASTEITRRGDGTVDAIISIRALTEFPELVAHELEHVIEQLDGIDLAARSRISGSGVRASDPGMFETLRATRVGAQVARETLGDK